MKLTPGQRSVEHQPSETAMATATLRALAACDEREEIRGQDYLAQIFLTQDRKHPLQDPAARAWVMKNKITPGEMEAKYMTLRDGSSAGRPPALLRLVHARVASRAP